MAGSAAHDRAFLLVEHPGPWGRKALEESRWIPEHVRTELADRAARAGVRALLVRRHGAQRATEGFRVFLAYADPAGPRVETTVLAEPADLLGLDLDGLAAGTPAGLDQHERPLFLVCTNGRRDVCCAERGRPLVAALDAAYPDDTWESTHLGGHRFAGAMLVLPSGLSYGRVGAEAGLRIAELTLAGEFDVRHLRGRAAYSPAVQAAEVELLARLHETRVDALELVGTEGDKVRFRHGDQEHAVTVTEVRGEPGRQSCADDKTKPAISFLVE